MYCTFPYSQQGILDLEYEAYMDLFIITLVKLKEDLGMDHPPSIVITLHIF